MKRRLFLLITLFAFLGMARGEERVTYLQNDSLTICRLLDEAHSQPRTTNFPLFFARKFLDIPSGNSWISPMWPIRSRSMTMSGWW